jgi:hypothetical protein
VIEKEGSMPTEYTCPHCGTTDLLAPGQRFCANCRQLLEGATMTQITPLSAAPASDRSVAPVAGAVPYESGHQRARATTILLWIWLGLAVLSILSDVLEIGLIESARAGQDISTSEATLNDTRQQLIALVQFSVYLGIVVSFLMWFHRAYRNLPALGAAGLKYTPGWTIGAWFVPIMNLGRPFQIMKEIWQASVSREDTRANVGLSVIPVPSALGWWWGTWLVGGILGRFATQMARLDDLPSLIMSDWVGIAATIFSIAAGALLIWIIREVDRLQEERQQQMVAAFVPPPYPPPGVAIPYVSDTKE